MAGDVAVSVFNDEGELVLKDVNAKTVDNCVNYYNFLYCSKCNGSWNTICETSALTAVDKALKAGEYKVVVTEGTDTLLVGYFTLVEDGSFVAST